MVYRDTQTGLGIEQQKAYEPDPPARTTPLTAYLSEDDSADIYKPPTPPQQPYFDTDKGVHG